MKRVIFPVLGGIGNQLFQVAASLSPSEFSKPVLVSSLGTPNLNKDGKAVCFEMLSSDLFSDFYQEKFNFFQEKKAAALFLVIHEECREVFQ